MAEELLVKEALTPEMIDDGRRLVTSLEEAHWPFSSAFWLFDQTQNNWRLYIASPEVEAKGPRNSYTKVGKALQTDSSLSLSDISIVPARKGIPKLLSKMVSTAGKIQSGIRLTRDTINGHYIADALIYKTP